ncbi:MAG: DUF2141 domain-containing protein [Alphaproteobacteria bacterium]|nr:DUF2141 domain-containing protein [Alphaproteobacteria bacterium]
MVIPVVSCALLARPLSVKWGRRAAAWALIAGFAALPVSGQAQTSEEATLTIKIERVSKHAGYVRLALYDGANWGGTEGKPAAGAVVPAKPGETVIALRGLKPGVYAIKTFQDENSDGEMNFDWFGIPTERFGFSNDAKPTFQQPSFDSAKFTLQPGANEMTIHLRWLF